MSDIAFEPQRVARLTYYVVQAYSPAGRGGISADEPVQARDHGHAIRLCERYRWTRAGAVAFYRTGDPASGEWDDAVIIARHGRLPAEIDDLAHENREPAAPAVKSA